MRIGSSLEVNNYSNKLKSNKGRKEEASFTLSNKESEKSSLIMNEVKDDTLNFSTVYNNAYLESSKVNSFEEKKISSEATAILPELTDPVSQAIRENVKDPIDMEEDLRFWKSCEGFKPIDGKEDYEWFLKLKKMVVGFPPPTAPGRVRRAFRENMERFPEDVRSNIQAILTFTYGLYVKDQDVESQGWSRIMAVMKEHIGEIGDPAITNFDLLRDILNNC